MEKKQQLENFISRKINQIDQCYENEKQDMERLKLATMRASYAKIMESFLKNDKELPKSYYEQAIIYLKNGKTDQAILQAQLAKRKLNSLMKDDNVRLLAENIDLLLVEAYHKSKKSEDALSIIEEIEISSDENKQKYLSLKAKIFQTFDNQEKSKETYILLHEFVVQKYGAESLEDGLCLIKMGKNIGHFKNHQEGIKLMNKGMQILINHRYHNPDHVAQIYQTLAGLSRQIQDFDKEYSSLICAHSMIKQLKQNQQKRSIEVLNKLSSNLTKRGQKQRALQFLSQIQQIERKIYGQSSTSLGKTVRKIIQLLYELNRPGQIRKYQNQYEHLIGSRIVVNNTSIASPASSLQHDRRSGSNLKNTSMIGGGSVSRMLN